MERTWFSSAFGAWGDWHLQISVEEVLPQDLCLLFPFETLLISPWEELILHRAEA